VFDSSADGEDLTENLSRAPSPARERGRAERDVSDRKSARRSPAALRSGPDGRVEGLIDKRGGRALNAGPAATVTFEVRWQQELVIALNRSLRQRTPNAEPARRYYERTPDAVRRGRSETGFSASRSRDWVPSCGGLEDRESPLSTRERSRVARIGRDPSRRPDRLPEWTTTVVCAPRFLGCVTNMRPAEVVRSGPGEQALRPEPEPGQEPRPTGGRRGRRLCGRPTRGCPSWSTHNQPGPRPPLRGLQSDPVGSARAQVTARRCRSRPQRRSYNG